jgi:hypothetical protein
MVNGSPSKHRSDPAVTLFADRINKDFWSKVAAIMGIRLAATRAPAQPSPHRPQGIKAKVTKVLLLRAANMVMRPARLAAAGGRPLLVHQLGRARLVAGHIPVEL